MNRIIFNLPLDAGVKGAVYDTKDPAYLHEDLLEIELANGIFIDVGWYPHKDSMGCFVLSVFKEDWDNLLQDEVCASTPAELKAKIDFLLEFWKDRRPLPLSAVENQSLLARCGELGTFSNLPMGTGDIA